MSLLFETLQIIDGEIQRAALHHQRCNASRQSLLGIDQPLMINNVSVPTFFRSGTVKCKIEYSRDIQNITFQHYTVREIKKIKMVNDDAIDYSHKYSDRQNLLKLYHLREDAEEILIIKGGILTDSYYYNCALYNGKDWVTPKTPLLKGTMRQFLLNTDQIVEDNIQSSDIDKYSHIRLFNALTPFGKIELPTSAISS